MFIHMLIVIAHGVVVDVRHSDDKKGVLRKPWEVISSSPLRWHVPPPPPRARKPVCPREAR